ncbi:MAG: dihydropteroate synthase [Deltaproteobacteria bacterium]|nr:dihydropteroate synthase [Deltaproteobacteria bacterium]MBI3389139.1 dihydropteroate synthase [Deltaproteobacteria bacterium]
MGVATLAGVPVGDGQPVRLVGVINVSPESFYGGSVVTDARALIEKARVMVSEGADILDVGAMSTAPYLRTQISEAEEVARMTAAMRALASAVDVPLSADTQRATVAAAAFDAGATILNDVSGLSADAEMTSVARRAQGLILMAPGNRATRQPPLQMIQHQFREILARAERAGIPIEQIVLDPGIGFHRGSALSWDDIDREIINGLNQLRVFGRPLLVGISRKSIIGKWTDKSVAADRLFGSLSATAIAVYNGAALIRTHDVAATRDAVRVAERLRS